MNRWMRLILLVLVTCAMVVGCGAGQALRDNDEAATATEEMRRLHRLYVESDSRGMAEVEAAREEIAWLRRELERLLKIIERLGVPR